MSDFKTLDLKQQNQILKAALQEADYIAGFIIHNYPYLVFGTGVDLKDVCQRWRGKYPEITYPNKVSE